MKMNKLILKERDYGFDDEEPYSPNDYEYEQPEGDPDLQLLHNLTVELAATGARVVAKWLLRRFER